VISYSGPKWTDSVRINNTETYDVFNLSNYGDNYVELGDPYSIYVPGSFVDVGQSNTIRVTTGLSPVNSTEGSLSNKIIYTLAKDIIAYSSISSSAEGCNWNIQFEDDTIANMPIPANYSRDSSCDYTGASHLPPPDGLDALQTAIYNLLELLDFDLDGKLDIKFTEQDFEISSNEMIGIPYDWSTEVQVRRWD